MIRNYIRKQLWRVVLAAARYDEHLGLLALRYFAAIYFVIEPPDIGPDPKYLKKTDWDRRRQDYFNQNFS